MVHLLHLILLSLITAAQLPSLSHRLEFYIHRPHSQTNTHSHSAGEPASEFSVCRPLLPPILSLQFCINLLCYRRTGPYDHTFLYTTDVQFYYTGKQQ